MEHTVPQIIFQSVHRGVCPRQTALADLKAFIPLGLAEKEKPFQWLGITKSCHVVGNLASRFLRELVIPLYLLNPPLKRVKGSFPCKFTNIIHTSLGQTKISVTVDTLFFFLKQTLMILNLPKL